MVFNADIDLNLLTAFKCRLCLRNQFIIKSGIETVVTYKPADGDEHWLESIDKSRAVFEEAGVEYLELDRAPDAD